MPFVFFYFFLLTMQWQAKLPCHIKNLPFGQVSGSTSIYRAKPIYRRPPFLMAMAKPSCHATSRFIFQQQKMRAY